MARTLMVNGKCIQMPLNEMPTIQDISVKADENKPAFYGANFNLDETGDTFIDMRNFGKRCHFYKWH